MKAFALVCAVMALTLADALPEETPQNESDQTAESHLVKRSFICHGSWSLFRRRCFYYVATPMTWAKAEKNCLAMGGNLASVHNILEYHEIQRVIIHATHQYIQAWIGGTDAQEESQWFWSDGTRFNYLDWCRGEPNNYRGNQHCLHINHAALRCWDDYKCSLRLPSVCARRIGYIGD